MNLAIWHLRSTHFGKIGFRLSLVAFCCVLALVLSIYFSGILFIMVAVLGIALLILSFGTILALIPDYLSKYNSLLNSSASFAQFLVNLLRYLPILAIVSMVASLIGCVFLALNKNEKHWGQFIFCVVSFILCLIVLVLNYCGAFASLIG